MRIRLVALAAALALTLPVVLAADEPRQGGTLIFGRGADSITLDPALAQDGESIAVIDNVFDSLVRYSDDAKTVEPALAEKWEVSKDGKTWTFHLAAGVTFHDGTPLDAEAVVFTFERFLKKDHPFFNKEFVNAELYSAIKTITAKDAKTVEFTLERPVAAFLANLTVYTARIVCPTAYKKDPKAYAQKPIGTGAFTIRTWEPAQKIILEANKSYFKGRPHLDKVILVPIKENASRLEQLKAGKLHIMDGVAPTQAKEVEAKKDLTLIRQTGMNVGYLALNVEKKPWNEARLRRAVALALDPPRIVATNFQGMGTVARNLMPPFIFGWDESARERVSRKDEAKKLLAETGVSLPLKVELLHMSSPRPYMPEPKQTALVIQDDLRQVGIETSLATMDWSQYIPKTRAGEFEACLLGWTGDTSDPDNFLYVLAGKEHIDSTNVSRYADKTYSDLCLAAQSELDLAKRKQLYLDAQKKLREDAPLIPLVHADQLAGVNARVKNFKLHPTGRREFRGVWIEK